MSGVGEGGSCRCQARPEMPQEPDGSHENACDQGAKTLLQPRQGESAPAEFFSPWTESNEREEQRLWRIEPMLSASATQDADAERRQADQNGSQECGRKPRPADSPSSKLPSQVTDSRAA